MEFKTCIFDVDGVLNYYPESYVDFINDELKTSYADLHEAKENIPYKIYKQLKLKYRVCGVKQQLPVRLDAVEILADLRKQGFYIIILSSRPVHEINSLIMQTSRWLHSNNLFYDYLLFNKEKHLEVIKNFDNVTFIVEDNRAYANSIAKYGGYKVYLLNNQYNQGEVCPKVTRINRLREIEECYI